MMKKNLCAKKESQCETLTKKHMSFCHNTASKLELAKGYAEMSRINLSLAEDALAADNEALALCEQKLAECE